MCISNTDNVLTQHNTAKDMQLCINHILNLIHKFNLTTATTYQNSEIQFHTDCTNQLECNTHS